MDGVGNEYGIIPEPYWQTTEQFPDTQGGRDIDPSNFDAKATITYSLGTNLIYAYSEVFDDISIPPDTWQFMVDADHSGGDCYPDTDDNARWHASACQQYEVYNHIPGEEGDDPVHFFWGTATWLPEEGWYNITCTFDGEKDAAGTVYREVQIKPLDDLNSPRWTRGVRRPHPDRGRDHRARVQLDGLRRSGPRGSGRRLAGLLQPEPARPDVPQWRRCLRLLLGTRG